jgi:signal transduction histidine kinase
MSSDNNRLKTAVQNLEDDKKVQSEEVIKALSELESVNATRNKFLSIIAHDLRNPFNHMMGFGHLLTDEESELSCEEKGEIINALYISMKHTHKLLEDLLQWANTQSKRIIVSPVDLKLDLIIQQVCQNLSAIIAKKKISIECQCPPDLWVYADKELLSTIIRNMLSNAVKFSYEKKQITIAAIPRKEVVLIKVMDKGIGIPKENQSKIFVMDDRLTTDGTKEEKGSGLGLSRCKEFVNLCDGEIGFESEEGKGSTFFFTIPQIFMNEKS